jgi:hypothetical protein
MPVKTLAHWRSTIIIAGVRKCDEDIKPRLSFPYGVPADLWLLIAALLYIVRDW